MSVQSGACIAIAEDLESNLDDASDLTLGAVVCGNPSKALRARERNSRPPTRQDTRLFTQVSIVASYALFCLNHIDLVKNALLKHFA